jgi:hypothetical protein
MNKSASALLIITLLIASGPRALSQSKPPALYVDKGACPFECCTYRKWKTIKKTVAYVRPDKRSRRVGTFKAGSEVVGLTGEVRTVPGRFVILKNHGRYRPGDVLWVYTPLGEGFYKVWYKGRMHDEELEYMSGPYERSIPSCEETPECWGKLEKELRSEWWVKVRSAEGWVGWTDQAENFGDKDACG